MKVFLKKPWTNPSGRVIPAGRTIDVLPAYAHKLQEEGIGIMQPSPHETTYPISWKYVETRQTPTTPASPPVSSDSGPDPEHEVPQAGASAGVETDEQIDYELEQLLEEAQEPWNRDNAPRRKRKKRSEK
jgi:hypothetical protein